eukprot:3908912-Pyramimonas_sp.AAC.1
MLSHGGSVLYSIPLDMIRMPMETQTDASPFGGRCEGVGSAGPMWATDFTKCHQVEQQAKEADESDDGNAARKRLKAAARGT